jgi:ABC-type multidrug transport system fused ATPase/permease subunit
VVIAHRLSTVKNADVVAVVDGGAVVEKVCRHHNPYFSL